MMRRTLAAMGLAVLMAVAGQALAQDRETSGEGAWIARGATDLGSGTCEREWVCSLTGSIGLADNEDLAVSEATTTLGTYSTSGDTLGRCQAPSPTTTCSWQIIEVE